MSEDHHRFIVDADGKVTDRATPAQQQIESYRAMNDRAFRRWENENGLRFFRLGGLLIVLSIACFTGWDMKETSTAWGWGIGGAVLALIGVPLAVYGFWIMCRPT